MIFRFIYVPHAEDDVHDACSASFKIVPHLQGPGRGVRYRRNHLKACRPIDVKPNTEFRLVDRAVEFDLAELGKLLDIGFLIFWPCYVQYMIDPIYILRRHRQSRSEERRVGKECVVRVDLGGGCINKKKKTQIMSL